jgi:hypothetical protein
MSSIPLSCVRHHDQRILNLEGIVRSTLKDFLPFGPPAPFPFPLEGAGPPPIFTTGETVFSGANYSQSSPYDMSFTMSFTISLYIGLDTQQSTPNARKHTKTSSRNGNEPSRRRHPHQK